MKYFGKFLLLAVTGVAVTPSAHAQDFETRAANYTARLVSTDDQTLEKALTSLGCRYVGGGGIGATVEGREGGTEISLKRAYKIERVEGGRVVGRSSNEIRRLVAPDANGLSPFVEAPRGTHATQAVPVYGMAWRNEAGVQFQLRLLNAADEEAAQAYLRPMALRLQEQL